MTEAPPDIETSSANYAQRFAGPVGEYFLEVQARQVSQLLTNRKGEKTSILELGGGHLQLAPILARAGHRVTVHGSTMGCFSRVGHTLSPTISLVVGSLDRLPFADQSFDVVLAVRLIAHVKGWRELICEMARIARHQIVIDYAPLESFNVLTPLLFPFKKLIEKNTRHYLVHRTGELRRQFERCGFSEFSAERQFFLPMGVHRGVGRREFTERVEDTTRLLKLTNYFGSPGVISALREGARD